ncbi:hypothetical protein OAN94_07605 [Verrucomicrobiales bacterium]|nr:hypothetical protein [Verrucomicrobiales bacterium]MDB4467903.1 hypothetical protein [Verrucomicrobiales bacterium]MDC0504130.1 hypothetical protein [Verrucomicrobiales bacterium]
MTLTFTNTAEGKPIPRKQAGEVGFFSPGLDGPAIPVREERLQTCPFLGGDLAFKTTPELSSMALLDWGPCFCAAVRVGSSK